MNGTQRLIKSMLFALVGSMFMLMFASLYFIYIAYSMFQIGTDGGNIAGWVLLVLSGGLLVVGISMGRFAFPLLFDKEEIE